VNSNVASRLTGAEAKARLKEFGYNTLPEKKGASLWLRLARQFQSPLIYILLFALVVDLLIWVIGGRERRSGRFKRPARRHHLTRPDIESSHNSTGIKFMIMS